MTDVLALEVQRPEQPDRAVLLVTDNGHGLGHLTRMMAIARRLAPSIKPYILTCSKAHTLASEAGFDVDYLPKPAEMDMGRKRWGQFAVERLSELVDRHGIELLAIDHVHPWSSLRELRNRHPTLRLVWCRRGLWRSVGSDEFLQLAPSFDRVLEPLDLATLYDRGPTTHVTGATRIAPVTILDRDELLSRRKARTALKLPTDGRLVLVQLSADAPDSLARLATVARDHLGRVDPAAVMVVPRHPLHPSAIDHLDGAVTVDAYPMVRYFAAFDYAISTAGYNTFHELVLAAVPTLFVARDTPKLDNQRLRANSAPRAGFGLHIQRLTPEAGLEAALSELADPRACRRMRTAAAQLLPSNGAHEAAFLLAKEMSSGRGA